MAKRSKKLIANFVNGFAPGWFFAIPEAFKDALDIKKNQNTKEKKFFWTQGKCFNFKAGDTFYSSKDAYEEWESPWDKTSAIVQVQAAKPAGESIKLIEETGEAVKIWDEGWVRFMIIRKPAGDGMSEQEQTEMTCSQIRFVMGLLTGHFVTISGPENRDGVLEKLPVNGDMRL